jgi:hypothetical protein
MVARAAQVTVPAHNSPVTVNEFAAADVSGIADAYAEAGRRDEPLFWHLSAVRSEAGPRMSAFRGGPADERVPRRARG